MKDIRDVKQLLNDATFAFFSSFSGISCHFSSWRIRNTLWHHLYQCNTISFHSRYVFTACMTFKNNFYTCHFQNFSLERAGCWQKKKQSFIIYFYLILTSSQTLLKRCEKILFNEWVVWKITYDAI